MNTTSGSRAATSALMSTWGICAPLYGGMRDRQAALVDRAATSDRLRRAARHPTLTPQSKPVTHASRLVAHDYAPLVAFGLGPGILAAGPVTYRQYSLLRRLCEPELNSLVGLARTGHRVNGAFRSSPEAPSQSCWQATIHR
jgi:hypothetical protein